MLDLGATDFYIAVPSLPQHKFEKYSTRLFDEWAAYVEKTLTLSDYSLVLEVEEGSVKGIGKVGATLFAVYLGIGTYGSFISGIDIIRGQINTAGDFLAERAASPFAAKGIKPKIRKHGGTLARIQRLFLKVQRGEMTSEQAIREVEALLGDEAATAPEFMRKLEESLKQAPRFHQQQLLPLDSASMEDLEPISDKGKLPRPFPKKLQLAPPPHFRVEVWRESKKGERKVRVVPL